MTGKRQMRTAAAALVGLTAAPAWAQSAEELQNQIADLQVQVAELRQQESEDWLNGQRKAQVEELVREVLADADGRAGMTGGAVLAGHDGDHFYLTSEDGSYLMEIAGQLQFRWIGDSQDGRDDENDSGFQFRRAKLNFSGHVADPKLSYELTLAHSRKDGNIGLEDAVIGYELYDNVEVLFGKSKLPFLREELVSSKRQLGVDRSLVTEYFTLNRGEQVQLAMAGENVRGAVSLNDGANSDWTDYNRDDVEFAVTARGDLKLAGDWGQAKDFIAWGDRADLGAFVGGAVHYQAGDGENGEDRDYFAWTVDGLVETGRLSVMSAFHGGHVMFDDDLGTDDRDMYGLVAQAGYLLPGNKWQPFARWNWIDDGLDATEDDLQAVSAGVNYFLSGHAAKFTTDVVYVYEGAAAGNPSTGAIDNPSGASAFSSGLGMGGFDPGIDEDFYALRAQFQLLF
ncbi:MAG: porin [Phycisphaeraceae bacterium]